MWDQSYRYYAERNRLSEILPDDEVEAIKETSLNTHYTAIPVVDQIWKAAQRLGFNGGRVLEPGMGVGNFFGRIPDQLLHETEMFGVEKNPLSGAMATQLYPDAKVLVQSYEDTKFPNNAFDMIIGNPPFADIKIADPEYSSPKLSLHNYFLVKSLDKLRPGGIACCITSHYTLDTLDDRARREMFKRADLVGAIRLPETAFEKNANTSVTTDILFFRKRLPNEPAPEQPAWIDSTDHPVPTSYAGLKPVAFNNYFDEHTEMALGVHSGKSRMYGSFGYTMEPFENDNTPLAERIAEAIKRLPENIVSPYHPAHDHALTKTDSLIPAPNTVKNHAYFIDEGKVWLNEDGVRTPLVVELETPAITRQLKSLIGVRDTLKEVIRLQLDSTSEEQLKACQARLLADYNSYRAKYGPLNNRGTARLFESDPEYPLLTSLENIDPETAEITLADIFTKRTLRPYEPLSQLPSDPKAAMLQVLADRGRLDTALMAELLDKPEEQVIAELVASNLIYKEPNSQTYQTADEYLSGNVRQRLRDAEGATLLDPSYERNVKALQVVQPETVPFIDIDIRLGQTWFPPTIYAEFLTQHLAEQRLGDRDRLPSITRDLNGRWNVDLPGYFNSINLTRKWAGGGISGHKLLEYGLNLQEPTVYRRVADDKQEIDAAATAGARARLHEIKDAFGAWIKHDDQALHHGTIERIYNETFNAIRLREYDGGHLNFPGLNPDRVPRPYQARAVWRGMVEGRELIDHFVGSGKSLTSIILGMEMRRIGVSRKNMYVVPNNMIQQWREEFKKAYPAANVLAATERDFDSSLTRRRLFSRIATNNWDAIVVPQSQFDMLPISPERESLTIQGQIQDLKDQLREFQTGSGNSRSEKRTERQIQNKIQKFREKLKELTQGRKDDTIYFDDLGIDRLFVDEAQAYKAMSIVTKMGNIAGISHRDSQRAQRILAKIEFMQDTHNERGVIFMTATPITNTLGEQYVMTRYLAKDILRKANIHNFDDWAANFAEPVTRMEYATDGISIRPKTALASYVNVPELQLIWSQFADVMLQADAEQLGYVKLPKPVRTDLLVKVTEAQEPLLQAIAERGELLSLPMSDPDRPDPTEDNWLKLDSDASAISLDARLYDPDCPDDEGSKANTAVRKALDVLERTAAQRGTVLMFADRYQRGDFNLFHDIKSKLIDAGIPESQVAIVHDYKKGRQFFGMQQAMREGRIRVLLGTTEKCGVGVNIQTRLKALFDLDMPQRPDQMEQRHGRMRRDGNIFDEVEFYRLISEPRDVNAPKAHDLQRAQLLERKQTFLSQFKAGGRMGRKIEDIAGETRLSPQMFALAKAQATGNPLAMEKIKLEYEIKNITLLARSSRLDHYNTRQEILHNEHWLSRYQTILPKLQAADQTFRANEVRDADGSLVSLQVRFNDLEFNRLKDANEYLRTMFIEKAPAQLIVNGLDIPVSVSNALTKDEIGNIFDVVAVRYCLADEWHDAPKPAGNAGAPTGQSLLTSILRRGLSLPEKIRDTEQEIRSTKKRINDLNAVLAIQNPYEARLKEYEERLSAVEKELLGDKKEVEELVDAEAEQLEEDCSTVQELTPAPVIDRETTLDTDQQLQENEPPSPAILTVRPRHILRKTVATCER